MTPSKKTFTRGDLEDLEQHLTEQFSDDRWLRVLKVLAPTGVADALQIQTATGLSRDQFNRLCDKVTDAAGDDLIARVEESIPRPGVRGRPPVVYQLGELGAGLLRRHGYPNARPSNLSEPKAIAHAQSVLYVRQAAQEAGLDVETECNVEAGEQTLRPDNLVTLEDDTNALFEVEQGASYALIRRITGSLERKIAFFGEADGETFSPTVRVVFNLSRTNWEKTVRTWRRTIASVREENGGTLPFEIVAMPLHEFLERPDWDEPPASDLWISLSEMPMDSIEKEDADEGIQLPELLRDRSPRDDFLILRALWQNFEDHIATIEGHELTEPDPRFFEVMTVIHQASFDESKPALARARYPHASIYLMRTYMQLHPDLVEGIDTIRSRRMHWNATMVVHRMQTVIREFMRYHGWHVGRDLLAFPNTSNWRKAETRDFKVAVSIDPEIMMPARDGIVPTREEVQTAESALEWVLLSLFAHSTEIGLKRPPYW